MGEPRQRDGRSCGTTMRGSGSPSAMLSNLFSFLAYWDKQTRSFKAEGNWAEDSGLPRPCLTGIPTGGTSVLKSSAYQKSHRVLLLLVLRVTLNTSIQSKETISSSKVFFNLIILKLVVFHTIFIVRVQHYNSRD